MKPCRPTQIEFAAADARLIGRLLPLLLLLCKRGCHSCCCSRRRIFSKRRATFSSSSLHVWYDMNFFLMNEGVDSSQLCCRITILKVLPVQLVRLQIALGDTERSDLIVCHSSSSSYSLSTQDANMYFYLGIFNNNEIPPTNTCNELDNCIGRVLRVLCLWSLRLTLSCRINVAEDSGIFQSSLDSLWNNRLTSVEKMLTLNRCRRSWRLSTLFPTRALRPK